MSRSSRYCRQPIPSRAF